MVSKARHMDFGTPNKATDYSPVSFTIAGEEFECKRAVQGQVLLDFIADADSNESGRAATGMQRFFREVMSKKEHERFTKLTQHSEYVFDMEELAKISAWLVEQYTNRPKELSKISSLGQKQSGPTSMADAS
jgi:hypothetical protein